MDTELLTDGEKLASIDLIEAATSEAWRRAMAAACESNYKLGFISQNYFLVSKKINSKKHFCEFSVLRTFAPSTTGTLQTTECKPSFVIETAAWCCLSISPQDSSGLSYTYI